MNGRRKREINGKEDNGRRCLGYAGYWEMSAIHLLDLLRHVAVINQDAVLCGCLDLMQKRLNDMAAMPELPDGNFDMLVAFHTPKEE